RQTPTSHQKQAPHDLYPHTLLTPYWADRLGKRRMFAYQASERGGELQVELGEDGVYITGGAVTVVEGRLGYRGPR
ncbi:MAG: hypothetical protein ACE5Z5_01940, partial [Candidatus Bathyarchaeia archaeon]